MKINQYLILYGFLLHNNTASCLSHMQFKSGGRAASSPDKLSRTTIATAFENKSKSNSWKPFLPPNKSEAKLSIVHITDVYTLGNFASIKTLLQEARAKMISSKNENKVISILTGDFLSPYLLSSIDKGSGMMNALAKTPIDYLTWGNHEADIDHRTVCNHVKNYPGIWINSNMPNHAAMQYQTPFDIIDICSPDGSNKRRIGLIAVLSNEEDLYSHFKSPGAFGGANIDDPWKTLKRYKELLEGPEYNCDLVIPLQHLYVPDDYKTCQQFDFPVILSGHDHHRVDEIVNGTRLLKPGLDAIYVNICDISWCDGKQTTKPMINAEFVPSNQWKPDPDLQLENIRAYDALLPLRNTELARVPPTFEPLSSSNARGQVTTMGRYICSLLRSSLNVSRRQRLHNVDAVILMGGNIRGGTDYPNGCFFSLEALEAEIKSDESIAVVKIPGRILADGIEDTHAGDPIPGWMQYDNGIKQDSNGKVTHVADKLLDPDRIYRVATKINDLTNSQSKPLTAYFTANPNELPAKGAYVNIHAELMSYFARNVWRKIWDGLGHKLRRPISYEIMNDTEITSISKDYLDELDLNHDHVVSIDEIHIALKNIVGLSVDDTEKTLARFVHEFADVSGDGKVALKDFEIFCKEMSSIYENDKWRLAFPRGSS